MTFAFRKRDGILFIDPGVNFTGYSCWEEGGEEGTPYRLFHFGLARGHDGEVLDKCKNIAPVIRSVCNDHGISSAWIEIPNPTVYYQKTQFIEMQKALARASSVMKLFSITFYITSVIEQQLGLKCIPLVPSAWEPSKKYRREMEMKAWSLWHANVVLEKYGHEERLKTKPEENTADAINIGWMVLNSGKRMGKQ